MPFEMVIRSASRKFLWTSMAVKSGAQPGCRAYEPDEREMALCVQVLLQGCHLACFHRLGTRPVRSVALWLSLAHTTLFLWTSRSNFVQRVEERDG